MPVPFVDLAAQQETVDQEIRAALDAALKGSAWILGEEVGLFEHEFAELCEARFGVGTDSGLSALELALRAVGVGPGDEVITAANTFVATVLAISHVGATPVLVDADEATQTIDVELVERALTPRTKAIIPVHLYGRPAEMDEIMTISERRGLTVIEDACQAHGARYRGRRAGSIGRAAAYSFYPSKNLGAYGDGGMIVTSDETVRDSLRILRNYGQTAKYQHVLKGFNRRLDTLQAALLRVKLRRLDEWNMARRAHAELYDKLLTDADVVRPKLNGYVEQVWHLYVIRSRERDALQAHLERRGISTGIHYPIPVHLQPAFSELGLETGSFPVTERLAAEVLSLPMYPELTRDAVERVASVVHDFTAGRTASARAGVRGRPRRAAARSRA